MDVIKLGKLDDLGVLYALLPGFIAYKIVHLLTAPGDKMEAVEAIVTGLAYTIASLLLWELLKLQGSYLPTPDYIGLPLTATGIGLAVSLGITNDWLFPFLRRIKLSHVTSEKETWLAALNSFRRRYGEYCVVTFQDRRRLFGRIISVSECQENGHIYLEDAQWLPSDNTSDEPNDEPRIETGAFLVSLKGVEYLHLIPSGKKAVKPEPKGR